MSRYCGECGASLTAAQFYIGHCPICGARVDASQSLPEPEDGAISDNATRAGLAQVAPTSQWQAQQHPAAARTRSQWPFVWVLSLILAVALLLAGAGILALSQRGGFSVFASSNANANSNSHSSSSSGLAPANGASSTPGAGSGQTGGTPGAGPGQIVATAGPGQTAVPTAPLLPGGSPTAGGATPVSTAAPAPTATPGRAILSVSPTSAPSGLLCPVLGATVQFSVTNTGGSAMPWSAKASVSGYKVSPAMGTVDPGSQQTVTVSGINQSGTVTITAPDADNSPQQFSINCSLL